MTTDQPILADVRKCESREQAEDLRVPAEVLDAYEADPRFVILAEISYGEGLYQFVLNR
jgi:hypothetical protein